MDDASNAVDQEFSLQNYQRLAELRFQLRQFLQFSEQAARRHGIEPQQHQLMLAIKGLPNNMAPTVTALANRLCLKHHSTVELINRLVVRGAAIRRASNQDRRQVLVELTEQGEELLRALAAPHTQELDDLVPLLLNQMNRSLLDHPQSSPQHCAEGRAKLFEASTT